MPGWYSKQLGGHAPYAKYLSLLESVLTGSVGADVSECHPEQRVKLSRYGIKDGGVLGSCPSINTAPYSAQRRRIGRDWPTNGLTMIGKLRMRKPVTMRAPAAACCEHCVSIRDAYNK